MSALLLAAGGFVPGLPIPNAELTQFPADRLPLIGQKTGIEIRHYAGPEQSTSDLAYEAARRCLDQINFPANRLDAIVLATSTPDRLIPATAPYLQQMLGALTAFAFDLNSVCSGSIFALHMADCMIRAGAHSHVLVVAADIYSRFLDPNDFSTAPYFGDGAAAVLVAKADTPSTAGILSTYLRTDGTGADLIQIPGGGARLPASRCQNPRDLCFRMNGKPVYEFAVTCGTEAVIESLHRAGVRMEALDWLIPHQANIHICQEIARRCGIRQERVVINLRTRGNTASASPLLALAESWTRVAQAGRTACIVAFGGGLSYGAIVVRF